MKHQLRKLFFCLALYITTGSGHGGELKLLTYNVWYGFTTDAPGHPAEQRHLEFRNWVKSQAPDIVALQELNGYTDEKLKADAAAWGHPYSALLKTDGFPTGITSNQPITGVVRTLEGFHHGLLRAVTHGHTIYVVHLHPSNWLTRRSEIKAIVSDLNMLDPDTRAKAIVLGDFNTFSTLDRDAYQQSDLEAFFASRDQSMGERNLLDGRLDYQVTGTLESAGFTDIVASRRKPGQRPFGSFPTRLRAHEEHGDERRLDFIFVTPALAEKCLSARVIDDDNTQLLSDHLPVTALFATPD